MLRHLALSLAAAAGLALAGCAGDQLTAAHMRPGQGVLAVRLTDAPLVLDSIAEVNVFVERIDARRTGPDSLRSDDDDLDHDEPEHEDSSAAMHRDDDEDEGAEHADSSRWVTIATPNQAYNLLNLQNGVTAFLGASPIDTGHFRSIRLIVDAARSSIVLKNGTVLTTTSTPAVEFESKGRHALRVELEDSVEVLEGSTTTVILDLKLNQSLTLRGRSFRDGLLFRPFVSGRSHRDDD